MSLAALYQSHLDRVSRSFAFCIRELKEPLRSRVALAYLLCRALDTIEDSAYPNVSAKLQQMEAFEGFIKVQPDSNALACWLEAIPPSATGDEQVLLKDLTIFLENLHSIPAEERKILQDATLSMSHGMKFFLSDSGSTHGLTLSSQVDVNRYCFFVAGVVGEMLTRLFAQHCPAYELTAQRVLNGHHFGLYLQKINLLKDQREDEKVGRRLVPSRQTLWASLDDDLQSAFEYLLDIPPTEREYRLFCAWSLFLGLASLPWIHNSWLKKVADKIPRAVTQKLLADVAQKIQDDQALEALFKKMRAPLDASWSQSLHDVSPAMDSDCDFPAFDGLYCGHLSREHLQNLGMIGA